MTLIVWLFVFVAMLFWGIGDYYSKEFAIYKQYSFMFISFVAYCINSLLFYSSICRFNSLSILGTISNISYLLITLFVAFVIFKEVVSARQIIGLVLAAVSIVLMSWK